MTLLILKVFLVGLITEAVAFRRKILCLFLGSTGMTISPTVRPPNVIDTQPTKLWQLMAVLNRAEVVD